MYNLLVSSDAGAWRGEEHIFDVGRCVREYTEDSLIDTYGGWKPDQIEQLRSFPCIFAYEAVHELPPKFGLIKEIVKRGDKVRINYEIQDVDPFLSAKRLGELGFELDITKWELNRTHWALKNVDLPKELVREGIKLPSWVRAQKRSININTHHFDVALSFPGESRALLEGVAANLERLLGPDRYFYDNNYKALLARPALDDLLQDIYRNRARLIVVFIGSDYERKEWCGLEFRAIKDIIKEKHHDRIMFVRLDDGPVKGVFGTDGYINAEKETPASIADMISDRLASLED